MGLITDPVSAVAGVVQSILDKFPDPAQKAAANLALQQLQQSGELAQMTASAGIITAEASSTNKLASSWRPMLMYTFMIIILNNYIIAPYLQLFFHVGLQLALPPDMWDLLKIGVGGYVVGRSVEKGVGAFAASKATTPDQTAAIANIYKGH